MCPSRKILGKTKNGTFTFCDQTKLFQFVFNNLCFELYEWELEKFVEYLEGLDVAYWEKELQCSWYSRKIPISVGNKHFIILVNKQELLELKTLLTGKNEPCLLSLDEINYTFIEN